MNPVTGRIGKQHGHRPGGPRRRRGMDALRRPVFLVLLVSLLSWPVLAVPATAAGHVDVALTRVLVRISPATVHVGSALAITGSVSPKGTAPVVLERLVAKTWHTVGKAEVAARGGGFTFSVKAPSTPTGWVLRVTRAASTTAKGGVSALLHVRVVTPLYVVKATVATPVVVGAPVVVTGSVRPRATGSVQLQRLAGKSWTTLASATLTTSSSFSFSTLRPVGGYRLRVVKAFTTKVAGGVSKGVSVAVVAPPVTGPPPLVTTALLPAGEVGAAYTTTLTATGGAPPYVWTSSGLPAGLTFSTAGVISGTPTTVGVSMVAISVRDGAGQTGSTSVTLVVAARPRPAGRVWAWGFNHFGQLGNNSVTSSDVLVPVSGLTSVVAVAGGEQFALALRSDGTVWAWGYNVDGELGNNSFTDSHVPVEVTGLTSVTAIAAGGFSGYALRSDGTVWALGINADGELGANSASISSNVPVQVSGLTSITAIAAGSGSGYALRSNGTVWDWGYNGDGELGNSSIASSGVPVLVTGLTSVTAIAGGGEAGYALSSDGTVWAWGYNNHGQLGNGTIVSSSVPVAVSGLTSVTAIAGGYAAGYALRSDGTVWSWGYYFYGQLGNNATSDSLVPVQVTGLASVTAIAGGEHSAYALRSDGYVWAWGWNSDGELGNGTTTDSPVPVQASGLTGVIGIGSGQISASGYAIEAP